MIVFDAFWMEPWALFLWGDLCCVLSPIFVCILNPMGCYGCLIWSVLSSRLKSVLRGVLEISWGCGECKTSVEGFSDQNLFFWPKSVFLFLVRFKISAHKIHLNLKIFIKSLDLSQPWPPQFHSTSGSTPICPSTTQNDLIHYSQSTKNAHTKKEREEKKSWLGEKAFMSAVPTN